MIRRVRTMLFLLAMVLRGAYALGSPPPSVGAKVSPDTWSRFARQHHCFLALEDAYSTGKGTDIGMPPTALPRSVKTIPGFVKWLRARLPACTVWRDKRDSRIIHVVYTKALEWRANPLNQRLTFRGKMNLPQVASRVIRKKFPSAGLYCAGYQRIGVLPYFGSAVKKAYQDTVMDFDVRGMALREFLSTGLVYDLKGRYPPPILWRADYFLKRGKFTGRVDIVVHGVPLRAAPSAAAKERTRAAHHQRKAG